MELNRPLPQILLESAHRPPEWVAVRFKRHKTWLDYSWREFVHACQMASLGLYERGVRAGSKVAVLSQTRMEWALADWAILSLGAVTVPVYQSNKPEEIEFILNHSESEVLIVEDLAQLRKFESLGKSATRVRTVIGLHPSADWPEYVVSWDDLLTEGTRSSISHQSLVDAIKLSDVATLVYTSGTTGEPKGVVLTHQQIVSEVADILKVFPISADDVTLSFLPYAHVMGRVEMWLHVAAGYTLCFAESIDRIRQGLRETRPTVMMGVPRIFEKIYADIRTEIDAQAWRKMAFQWLQGQGLWQNLIREAVISKKVRDGLGGRLRFVVSGGAALDPQVAEFFKSAGLLLLEGYGLTETTAAITANVPGDYRFGTVGRPLPEVEIRLAEDGEILVKSHKVMREYYRDAKATDAAFRDGYFATGDIGAWTEDGFLRITDRKKDLIKTSGGKYVAPQKLENLLQRHPLISHALIHGEKRKYIVALITINPTYATMLAKENRWHFSDMRQLSQLPQMHEVVRKIIAQANSELASFETIKNFAVLPDDFTLEKGELTPSLKVKRKVCDERYRAVIDDLY